MTNAAKSNKAILVHSLPIISKGIKLTLESAGYEVPHVCECFDQAIDICLSSQIDLIVVGLSDNDFVEFDFIKKCRRQGLNAGIVVIANKDNQQNVSNAFEAGVNSFVMDCSTVQELLMAVSAAENNEKYVCARPSAIAGKPIKKDQKKDIWGYFKPVMITA